MKKAAFISLSFCLLQSLIAQESENLFQPFTWEWPTPNECRLGSGAPGPDYWQQKVDYKMDIRLLPEEQRVEGTEKITYHNRSPHTLEYLWLQLDQDIRKVGSIAQQMEDVKKIKQRSELYGVEKRNELRKGGYDIRGLWDASGKALPYHIGETNLRIPLSTPLQPGESITFQIDWAYYLNDATIEGRSGFEYFLEDQSYLFEIAQFYPRACVYDLEKGWQNRPFYGSAEFALEFGDYEVAITLPANYVVAATGTLTNSEEVLEKAWQKRLKKLKTEEKSFVIAPEEAKRNASSKSSQLKTWKFQAAQVRDFAFAASKKFIWDAMLVEIGGQKVIAQSFYPPEAIPLWDKYATHVVAHTLQTYSHHTFDYPYPQATAVHGPVWGMEYPMISFCGGRPTAAGYYSRYTKYRMIAVIIHEVGHNFFPMIVNSDERRWAWMDEGLNSFLEYLTERTWEPNFPHRRGPAAEYAYTRFFGRDQPIMTNPESIHQNGLISYTKAATGLNMLRELILGPDNFDYAFQRYAQRWAFKHPEPADFFRTMEDASGQDLEWFWRSWFYKKGEVNFDIESVDHYKTTLQEGLKVARNYYPSFLESEVSVHYIDGKAHLQDKFTGVTGESEEIQSANEKNIQKLVADHQAEAKPHFHIYHITIKNQGQVPVPIPMDVIFTDGSRKTYLLPAQVWMQGDATHQHEFRSTKEVVAFHLDGRNMLPDPLRVHNLFPQTDLGQSFKDVDWEK